MEPCLFFAWWYRLQCTLLGASLRLFCFSFNKWEFSVTFMLQEKTSKAWRSTSVPSSTHTLPPIRSPPTHKERSIYLSRRPWPVSQIMGHTDP